MCFTQIKNLFITLLWVKTTHPPVQLSDKNNTIDSISSNNLFDLVKHQYRQAITESKVDISPEVVTILSKPMYEIIVKLSVSKNMRINKE